MGSTSRQAGNNGPLVLVVEDGVLLRIELADMLEAGGCGLVAVASAEEALEVLNAGLDFAAVVTDVVLSPEGLDGYALARQVRERWGIGVVVMSGQVAPDEGKLPPGTYFLAKPIHEGTLLQLVHAAMHEGALAPSRPAASAMASETTLEDLSKLGRLTPRQQEVLELMAQGKSNRDIAQELGRSEHTVKAHLAVIFRALRVSNRVEATLVGLRQSTAPAERPPRHLPTAAELPARSSGRGLPDGQISPGFGQQTPGSRSLR
jgi:DNA-binding NarL/FixJ family response regulator